VALTKILATLGPATRDESVLDKLVEHGATLFRLNFSHGTFEDHKKTIQVVRKVSSRRNVPLTILGDLQGPKLRIGTVPGDGIELEAGQEVLIRSDIAESCAGERPELATDLASIGAEVEIGHRVLINDGAIRLLVVEREESHLVCRVTTGGLVTSRKGMNLPDSDLSVPSLTERDWECVEWAIENDVDYLALSFVRGAEEVERLRERLRRACVGGHCGTGLTIADEEPTIPVIAKIETPQAVRDIEAIVGAADGIMVARGDLGVEMDVAQVPMIQKRLVQAAHAVGKPVIVATQMLESMIEHPFPTRAEVSDVANAIVDGADCVMLSGETATGRFPILAVEMMRRVAVATERELRGRESTPTVPRKLREDRQRIAALVHGSWHMAQDVEARLVVIWSQAGGSARYLSRHNFHVPILAISSDERAVRRMNLLHGVFPVLWLDVPEHRSEFAREVDRLILQQEWAQRGEPVVLLAGKPLDKPGSVATVAIRYAGEFVVGE
jgi:pyruvate kinase